MELASLDDELVAELCALLLVVALKEVHRRTATLRLAGPELDDVAHQAADAVLAVLAKLDRFRGESRFATWVYRFAILEVSSKLGRHFWRRDGVQLDADAAMQQFIRDRNPTEIGVARHDRFMSAHAEGVLIDPEHSAAALLTAFAGSETSQTDVSR